MLSSAVLTTVKFTLCQGNKLLFIGVKIKSSNYSTVFFNSLCLKIVGH